MIKISLFQYARTKAHQEKAACLSETPPVAFTTVIFKGLFFSDVGICAELCSMTNNTDLSSPVILTDCVAPYLFCVW